MTDTRELQPGLHVARVLVGDNAKSTRVRVVNLTAHQVTLEKDQLLGGLYPVQIDLSETKESPAEAELVEESVEDLMKGISEEVPSESRDRLESLLREYHDVLSLNERNLGKTAVCLHRIDTGDAAPVRQPLRRQPPS